MSDLRSVRGWCRHFILVDKRGKKGLKCKTACAKRLLLSADDSRTGEVPYLKTSAISHKLRTAGATFCYCSYLALCGEDQYFLRHGLELLVIGCWLVVLVCSGVGLLYWFAVVTAELA
ncbi:hypothetical protein RRG08_015223 [Elysia crispata]|uniref:Transmembrane protein n=1 Tax=Elysia crispata TaxID=231223 RepID=A0AAE1A7E0_9GAST|nr:hypothetical protein RRG08_015223 [Elysia crispata]